MHPSSHWLLHFCRSWPAVPEFILQLQVRWPNLFLPLGWVKDIGLHLFCCPVYLCSDGGSPKPTLVDSSHITCRALGGGRGSRAQGLLLDSCVLVWLLSLYLCPFSLCDIGFFLALCTQGLLGCLEDVLRKSSCAGGFRDAVEEARANLQSQLLLNHSSAAFWARRQFELSIRSAHLLFGTCLWSHGGSGARPGTAFSFCPMPN